jgi:hypothetical protein
MNSKNKLPSHGRVECSKCFNSCNVVEFDRTKREVGNWRITVNPLAWGNATPEIVVLGFSKGPTQAGALASSPHDEIAYKGARGNVGKILNHVGLMNCAPGADLGQEVSRMIADKNGRFHFASLIRCTVERNDKGTWKGSGGGMLDKFVATPFGKEVSNNCTTQFLKDLPKQTKLVVMFGMGTKLKYVSESRELFKAARGGQWTWINDVSYTDGKVTVVHVEHFASQGPLVPQWLGLKNDKRSIWGVMAADAVAQAVDVESEKTTASAITKSTILKSPRPHTALHPATAWALNTKH